jgi:hypothetical protein
MPPNPTYSLKNNNIVDPSANMSPLNVFLEAPFGGREKNHSDIF